MQPTLQATLAPGVVNALEAVARDFLGKTLELGCAAARRRRSDALAPPDLAVGLERLWCDIINQTHKDLHSFIHIDLKASDARRQLDALAPPDLAVSLERLW